ncbi:MAG: aminoacyl-tRNA hydrolase [Patescibacteria group bacterium]|nr:aminoacyl-tRNA hydrolase [Patescibacteria group bacterium]
MTEKNMRMIVGLGNPGEQYKNTRHNLGFMAIDALADQLGLKWENNKKLMAELAKGADLILVKPQTFMNNSGPVVAAVLSYYKLLPKTLGLVKTANADLSEILTVIHDDLDIELEKFKISLDSRSAGHKGVESIINHLKTKNFKRLRIGIKASALKNVPADKFVLQKFSAEELKIIGAVVLAALNEFKK